MNPFKLLFAPFRTRLLIRKFYKLYIVDEALAHKEFDLTCKLAAIGPTAIPILARKVFRRKERGMPWEGARAYNWAANTMGIIGDKKAVPFLIDALKNGKGTIKVIEVVGKLRDPSAVPVLKAELQEMIDFQKKHDIMTLDRPEALVTALSNLGAPAFDCLADWLVDPDVDVNVRTWIARAFGFKGKKAVEPLVKVFDEINDSYEGGVVNNQLFGWVARSLHRIGDRSCAPALADMYARYHCWDEDTEEKIIKALRSLTGMKKEDLDNDQQTWKKKYGTESS